MLVFSFDPLTTHYAHRVCNGPLEPVQIPGGHYRTCGEGFIRCSYLIPPITGRSIEKNQSFHQQFMIIYRIAGAGENSQNFKVYMKKHQV